MTQNTQSGLSQPTIEYILDQGQTKLAILPADSGPVFIDFNAGKKAHRRQFGGGKGQPLARAIGLHTQYIPSVIDATAGMGSDSFVFASLGCEVLMIEKSEPVAQILADGLARGLQDPEIQDILNRITLVNADATEYLLQEKPSVDVIYLDPMYPEKKKSAAPKKEMKLLQTLVGPDLDSQNLLAAARQIAKYRVVVKRPKGAPYIGGQKPQAEISSPNTRYDLYINRALPSL
ncbi:class I SAM-dependent methyltransferase [Thiosulfativibrio zosterae]|nr:class I SAM-dependent methyltransferase [Thiosulfativibrio zosterae]